MNSKIDFPILLAMTIGTLSSTAFAQSQPITVRADSCYTLATQLATNQNPCPGDVYFETGANVDISSAGGSENLCLLPGTFATLAQIPSNYSQCEWVSYVEGMDSLAGKGLIVGDKTGQHHYKWRVQTNSLPQIVFDQEKID